MCGAPQGVFIRLECAFNKRNSGKVSHEHTEGVCIYIYIYKELSSLEFILPLLILLCLTFFLPLKEDPFNQ